MTATEILPNLFLGDMEDARHFSNGVIIFVGEDVPRAEPRHAIHIQIFPDRIFTNKDAPTKVDKRQMQLAIYEIDRNLKAGRRVLVHCYAGVERSPLVVACYLVHARLATDIYDAYHYIIQKRPVVQMCTDWL